MNTRQENKRSALGTVKNVLSGNQSIWQALPALVAAFSTLNIRLSNIDALVLAKNGTTKGVTADKKSARETMIAAALEVAGAVKAYGSDIGSAELQAQVDYTITDLRQARDTDITTICQGIHDTAQTTKIAAGSSLESEFAATDKLLEEKIDPLMQKYRLSQPGFFAAYQAARNIVNNAASHNGKNGNGNGNGQNTQPQPPPA